MLAFIALQWQSIADNMIRIGAANALYTLVGTAIVVVMMRLELQRRGAAIADATVGSIRMGKAYVTNFKRALWKCAPETFGLVLCVTLATALLAFGDVDQGMSDSARERQVWDQIQNEHSWLLCADTYLCLQSLLRVVMLVCALLRGDDDGPVPMCDETAALYACGGIARVALLVRTTHYDLDGPMGGSLPKLWDTTSCVLAVILGRHNFTRRPLTLLWTILCVAWLSSRNCLNLAESDWQSDASFVASYIFDGLAALVYFVRSLLIDRPFGCVTLVRHMMMALQAGFGVCYFVIADVLGGATNIVGAGSPVQVLQASTMAASAAYVLSAAMFVVEFAVDLGSS